GRHAAPGRPRLGTRRARGDGAGRRGPERRPAPGGVVSGGAYSARRDPRGAGRRLGTRALLPRPGLERAVTTPGTPSPDASSGTSSDAMPTAPSDRPDAAQLAQAMRALERSGTSEPSGPSRQSNQAGQRPGAASDPPGAPPSGGADAGRAEALRATAETLTAGGAPASLAPAAVAALGERAAELLHEDPWAVLGLPGVRPDQADGFARGLLGPACRPEDPRRAHALTVHLLERAALHGHTAVELGEVRAGLEKLGVPDAEQALAEQLGKGRVMAFQDEAAGPGRAAASESEDDEAPVRVLIALDRWALAEESLADGLVRLLSTFDPAAEAARRGDAEGARAGSAASGGADADASGAEVARAGAAGAG